LPVKTMKSEVEFVLDGSMSFSAIK
jgi:hypothetical protein